MYFDPTVQINFLDWGHISTTAFGPAAPPPPAASTLTATDIATAVATALPNAAAISAAVTSAIAAAPAPAPTARATTGGPAATTAPALTTTLWTFNPAGLPGDVRTRYDHKKDNLPILGSTVTTPYAGGNYYHLEGTDKLVLADGTFFLKLPTPDEKGLLRDPVYCEKDTYAGIRSWYQLFTQHAHVHGFYVHPLWCYHKDHGGNWGFTAGNDPDDDLPLRMQVSLDRMSQTLFRLLQKKDMFPKDSKLISTVQSCYGDGYKALKAILFNAHPVFFDQPATLITTYPKQRNLTMLEYYLIFQDYLQLKAYIANSTATLDDATELDVLIANSKYADYLNRVTRDERRQRSYAHKYTGAQLLETLQKHLNASDRPARGEFNKTGLRTVTNAQTPPRGLSKPTAGKLSRNTSTSSGSITRAQPTGVRVHHLTVSGSEDSLDTLSNSDDSVASLTQGLYDLPVPDDDQAREIFHVYSACVHQIKAKPTTADEQPCIVCGGNHRFDGCGVLNNTDFLKQHYIRYCQQIRREAAARSESFQGTAAQIPTQAAPVNFLDGTEQLDTDDEFDEEQDFQLGRT